MIKTRVVITLTTIVIVGIMGYVLSLFARGYRFDRTDLTLQPSGLLVMKSNPDGAQVHIDGEFKTATNANISLTPGIYDLEVKKDGYQTWSKRITIEREEVTEADAYLFKSAPSLTAITFTSSINPVPSKDYTKIAYSVPPTTENLADDKEGLWILETINLPIGFARDPRRITDGDTTTSALTWSPDGRQILMKNSKGSYLLDVGLFTPEASRVNVSFTTIRILAEWKEEETKKLEAQMRGLPEDLIEILEKKSDAVEFSPDEKLILYTASESAQLKAELIKPVPGASSQTQDRDIKAKHTYVYDIKEDRNFLIDENSETLTVQDEYETSERRLSWFPSSRHLVLAEKDKIIIMDIDGTNRQTVYEGSYVNPNAFPIVSNDRLIILTNLGANSSPANLYSLGIK